jgi:hypothetical protein
MARNSSGSEMFARRITWAITTYMPGLPYASTAVAWSTRRAFSGIPQTSVKVSPFRTHDPGEEGGFSPPEEPKDLLHLIGRGLS